MVFLGTTFCSGYNSLSSPPIKPSSILSLQMSDGVYNHLFLSLNENLTYDEIGTWDYDTKINAPFDENLEGGSSAFTLNTTDTIVIRRRELGKSKWTVIYVKEINTADDFNIHFVDKYARAGDHCALPAQCFQGRIAWVHTRCAEDDVRGQIVQIGFAQL